MATADARERPVDVRLVPAALTAWAVTAAGIVWPGLVPCAVVLVACAITGLLTRSGAVRVGVAGVAAVAVMGAAFGVVVALRSAEVRHHPITERYGDRATVTIAATESPRSLGRGRMMFRAGLCEVDGTPSAGMVLVFAPVSEFATLVVGRPATFTARIGRPLRADLTVAVLTATGRPTMGETPAVRRLAGHVRDRFSAAARRVLPADQAAMLPALVLGDTSAVTATTAAAFKVSGLTHLTAVSGANVTIVCGAALLSAALVGPRPAAALALVVLIAFVIVVEPSASVLRAAVMGGIGLFAVVSHRRRQAIPVLSSAVIALMMVAPQLAVDVGFALSVVATAALVVIAPGWSRRLVGWGWPKPLADAVCIAAAAQAVTAPLVAGISGNVSVFAVMANVLVGAVIPPITLIGTAAAALSAICAPLAELMIRFTGPELWWLLVVAERIAALPDATVPVPAGAPGMALVATVTIAVIVTWRWRWGRSLSVAGLCCLLAWTVSGIVGSA